MPVADTVVAGRLIRAPLQLTPRSAAGLFGDGGRRPPRPRVPAAVAAVAGRLTCAPLQLTPQAFSPLARPSARWGAVRGRGSRGSQRVAGLGEPGAAGGRAGRRAREASGRRGQPKDRAAWLSSRREAKGEGRRAERQPPNGEHDGELVRQRDGGLISLRGFLQNYWETNNLNHPYS